MEPLLDLAAARALEERLLADDPVAERTTLTRAGRAVGEAIRRDFAEAGPWPQAPRLLVVAGSGHNGADALLAATVLVAGFPSATVTVLTPTPLAKWKPLTIRAWETLANATGGAATLRRWTGEAPPRRLDAHPWTVMIDGLLGLAAAGPLRAPLPALLTWANAQPATMRVAVDLPTGLSQGGGPVFCADFTYATGSVKQPVAARSAVAHTGRLRRIDVGFFTATDDAITTGVIPPTALAPWQRLRPAARDKRQPGHVMLVGGSSNYPGAIQLAARAALQGGAGLVTVALPEVLAPAAAAAVPEAMWLGLPEAPDGGLALEGFYRLRAALERATVLVLGPGLSNQPEALAFAERLLAETTIPVVLDADALRPDLLRAARSARATRTVILTPHDGEARRLGVPLMEASDADAVVESTALRAWCAEHGVVLVRKGPSPRVVDSTRWGLVPAGGPVLARGGSGDVLAGLIGACLAAGEPAWEATAAAVLWHARAGDRLARHHGATAVRLLDLLAELPAALYEE